MAKPSLKPDLIDDNILKKLINKNFKTPKRSFMNKTNVGRKLNILSFLTNNWYYILIILFIGALFLLKYTERFNSKISPSPVKNKKERDTYASKDTSIPLSELPTNLKFGMGNFGYSPPNYNNVEDEYDRHMSYNM